MSTEQTDPEAVARATLDLLEVRLRRLEFLVSGNSDVDGVPTPQDTTRAPVKSGDTLFGKLESLQVDLDKLRRSNGRGGQIVRDVETIHSKVPELFAGDSHTSPSDLSVLSSAVLAHATLYPETASRFSSLQSLQIPSANHSAKLIELRPRIEAAMQKRELLELDSEELRDRSARCLEWWVKFGVVGMGELWDDWESRIHEVERATKRVEIRRKSEEGYV